MLYAVAMSIKYITSEKESRQKELLKMMSVVETDIEYSWFVTFMLFNLISATVASMVSWFLFPGSSYGLLWIFWIACLTSMSLFSMALAATTSKATKGILLGLLVYLMGFFFFLVLDSNSNRNFTTLHPVTTFCYGIKVLGYLADAEVGLTRETMYWTTFGTTYSLATVLLWFAKSMALWIFLTFYLNRVIPPEYGQALPPWFLLTSTYWRSFCPTHGIPIDDYTKLQHQATAMMKEIQPEYY